MRIEALASKAWDLFDEATAADASVVRPSMPVLYFGDRGAYSASPLRVVTVGLNPSRIEFDTDVHRFPAARDATPASPGAYLDALDGYFGCEPYRPWFNSYEPALNGLGASRRSTVAPP